MRGDAEPWGQPLLWTLPIPNLEKREDGEERLSVSGDTESFLSRAVVCLKDEHHLWQLGREGAEETNNQLILFPSFPLAKLGGNLEGKGA